MHLITTATFVPDKQPSPLIILIILQKFTLRQKVISFSRLLYKLCLPSRSGKSRGFVYEVREFLNSTCKSGKSLSLGMSFLGSKGVFVSKNRANKLISVASFLVLLSKDLPCMVIEMWSLVSKKSGKCQGIFFYPSEWQP